MWGPYNNVSIGFTRATHKSIIKKGKEQRGGGTTFDVSGLTRNCGPSFWAHESHDSASQLLFF